MSDELARLEARAVTLRKELREVEARIATLKPSGPAATYLVFETAGDAADFAKVVSTRPREFYQESAHRSQ